MNRFYSSMSTTLTLVLVALFPVQTGAQQGATEAQKEAQLQLEQTIEVMRSQGVPEAQIDEFRKMAQTFVINAESDEQKEARREARAAQDRAARRDARRSSAASEVVVTLGDDTYTLQGVCRTDPDSFSIGASAGDEKTAATFRVTRNAGLNDQYITDMRFDVDDSYLNLSPVPWDYQDGVFRFDGEVVVYTLFGPTSNRGQTEKTVRMTVTAPCEG